MQTGHLLLCASYLTLRLSPTMLIMSYNTAGILGLSLCSQALFAYHKPSSLNLHILYKRILIWNPHSPVQLMHAYCSIPSLHWHPQMCDQRLHHHFCHVKWNTVSDFNHTKRSLLGFCVTYTLLCISVYIYTHFSHAQCFHYWYCYLQWMQMLCWFSCPNWRCCPFLPTSHYCTTSNDSLAQTRTFWAMDLCQLLQ